MLLYFGITSDYIFYQLIDVFVCRILLIVLFTKVFCLQRILTCDFNGKKKVKSCDDLLNEFKLYLNNSVLLLGQRTYQKSNDPLQIWSRICSTTVFYTYIFGVFDKKLLKQFTDLLEKVYTFYFLYFN